MNSCTDSVLSVVRGFYSDGVHDYIVRVPVILVSASASLLLEAFDVASDLFVLWERENPTMVEQTQFRTIERLTRTTELDQLIRTYTAANLYGDEGQEIPDKRLECDVPTVSQPDASDDLEEEEISEGPYSCAIAARYMKDDIMIRVEISARFPSYKEFTENNDNFACTKSIFRMWERKLPGWKPHLDTTGRGKGRQMRFVTGSAYEDGQIHVYRVRRFTVADMAHEEEELHELGCKQGDIGFRSGLRSGISC